MCCCTSTLCSLRRPRRPPRGPNLHPPVRHSLLTARWLRGERQRPQTCWKSSVAVIIALEGNKQFIRAVLRRLNCCQDISNGFLGYHCLCTDAFLFKCVHNLFRNTSAHMHAHTVTCTLGCIHADKAADLISWFHVFCHAFRVLTHAHARPERSLIQ